MQRFTMTSLSITSLSVLFLSGLMLPAAHADTATAPQPQPIELQPQPAQSSEKQPTVNPVRIEAVKSVDLLKKEQVPTLSERDRLIQEYQTQRIIPSQE